MGWTTLAEGTPEEFRQYSPPYSELPKGTKIRATYHLSVPAAPLADLVFAEMLAPAFIDTTRAEVTDVYGDGWWDVVCEMEADPAWVVPLIIAIAAIATGILIFVTFIKLEAIIPPMMRLWILGMAVAGVSIVAALYIRYKTKALEGRKRKRR